MTSDSDLASRALAWAKSNDGGRLCVWHPAGSKPGDDTQPIMAVNWDNGGVGELGVFYNPRSDGDMQLICDIFNWALEELAPSELGWYGVRTYLPETGNET